jgi:hypothetical protein
VKFHFYHVNKNLIQKTKGILEYNTYAWGWLTGLKTTFYVISKSLNFLKDYQTIKDQLFLKIKLIGSINKNKIFFCKKCCGLQPGWG